MRSIAFTEAQCDAIESHIASSPDLETAFVLTGTVHRNGSDARFVVRDLHVPDDAAYNVRTRFAVELKSAYIGPIIRRARSNHAFVGFVHCHPGGVRPVFSPQDDKGEIALAMFLERQFGSEEHISVISGAEQWIARQIGLHAPVRVIRVGRYVSELTSSESTSLKEAHGRQIQAFGRNGQIALQRLRFAVVGVGGTGSIIAQALAHLGAQAVRLVDFDVVDATNLNRLVGATPSDVGAPKVEAVARHMKAIAPDSEVVPLHGDVTDKVTALQLLTDDIIFSCTDSHGSRAVLNQIAYQYYIPCFDTGVSIYSSPTGLARVTGRSQMLSPGLGCLTCGNLLDPDEVRRDLMTPAHRRADPYFVGERVAQPAVISINSTAASLSLTMALAAITRTPVNPRMQVYDAVHGTVRSVEIAPVSNCVVCSNRGALGRGRSWELPVRGSLA